MASDSLAAGKDTWAPWELFLLLVPNMAEICANTAIAAVHGRLDRVVCGYAMPAEAPNMDSFASLVSFAHGR